MPTINRVAGSWLVERADVIIDGQRTALYGDNPTGILIFTEDLYFSVVIGDGDVAPFASGDRMSGTREEDHAVVTRSLALFGTYTVDDNGDFADQVVLGSTFPNWVGLRRNTNELTETVVGDVMTEHLVIDPQTSVEITWRKAPRRQ